MSSCAGAAFAALPTQNAARQTAHDEAWVSESVPRKNVTVAIRCVHALVQSQRGSDSDGLAFGQPWWVRFLRGMVTVRVRVRVRSGVRLEGWFQPGFSRPGPSSCIFSIDHWTVIDPSIRCHPSLGIERTLTPPPRRIWIFLRVVPYPLDSCLAWKGTRKARHERPSARTRGLPLTLTPYPYDQSLPPCA